MNGVRERDGPQGLKPACGGSYGTAEAVPFPN
jgi:hypothetical protein